MKLSLVAIFALLASLSLTAFAQDEPAPTASETKRSVDDSSSVVLSAIRAGVVDLTGVTKDTKVKIVDIDGLTEEEGRSAVQQALVESENQIESLRQALRELDLKGLSEEDMDTVVAVKREPNGTLTVYVD
jgi:hypothetical protein